MAIDGPNMDEVKAQLDKVPHVLRAPWTPEQVQSLNEFQEFQPMHPFTHGHDDDGNEEVLVAEEDGWHCPNHSEYEQDWCWPWMANGSWRTIWDFAKRLTDEMEH